MTTNDAKAALTTLARRLKDPATTAAMKADITKSMDIYLDFIKKEQSIKKLEQQGHELLWLALVSIRKGPGATVPEHEALVITRAEFIQACDLVRAYLSQYA